MTNDVPAVERIKDATLGGAGVVEDPVSMKK
jgi:hypothetical protein